MFKSHRFAAYITALILNTSGGFRTSDSGPPGGGHLGRYFLGRYVPPGTPNWHPVLKKISPKTDTPF